MLYIELSIVVVLIFVNGLLAMSELALVSARRPLLEQMAKSGSRGAVAALALTSDPGRFLSSVQVGITLVGIIAGTFSGATLAARGDAWLESFGMPSKYAEPASYVVVVALITYLSVVIGELVPKQVGLRNAERVAIWVSRPMQIFALVATPIVVLLDRSARLGLKVIGQGGEKEQKVTDEEIHTLIAEAERSGLVEPEERSMISGVMRLGDRSVRAVMTPRPDIEWIDLEDDDAVLREALRTAEHHRVLAANGDIDHVVGVVPVHNALVALMDGDVKAVRGMVAEVPVVSDRIAAIDVVEQLRQSPVRMVLVVDEHGSIEGIVTEGDILKSLVADFDDEDMPRIVHRDDGSMLIDGSFPVDEAAEQLGLKLPERHGYSTVAGFVLDRLRHLPRVGESFRFGAWRFEVIDMDSKRVDKVLVSPQRELHRRV